MDQAQPIIGVVTYGRDENNRHTLPAEYTESVRRAGGEPFLIPPGTRGCNRILEAIDGLVLSGGGDIDPALYGGERHETLYMVDAERDAAEMALTSAAVEAGLPTLAVCRGAQMLNVALGGTLHVHLPEVYGHEVAHRLPPREPSAHPVTVEPDAHIARVMGCTECTPASWHHQAIAEVAPRLRVTGRSPDGVIEALELDGHPWMVAVQWHPELTSQDDPSQQRLFDGLVAAAAHSARGGPR